MGDVKSNRVNLGLDKDAPMTLLHAAGPPDQNAGDGLWDLGFPHICGSSCRCQGKPILRPSYGTKLGSKQTGKYFSLVGNAVTKWFTVPKRGHSMVHIATFDQSRHLRTCKLKSRRWSFGCSLSALGPLPVLGLSLCPGNDGSSSHTVFIVSM